MGPFVRWRNGSRLGWIENDQGCHIWTGARDRRGYAMTYDPVRRTTRYGARVRYEHEIGPVPDGLVLDHYVCDGGPKGCCNPHHMPSRNSAGKPTPWEHGDGHAAGQDSLSTRS